jgi:hypothetical protein
MIRGKNEYLGKAQTAGIEAVRVFASVPSVNPSHTHPV